MIKNSIDGQRRERTYTWFVK